MIAEAALVGCGGVCVGHECGVGVGVGVDNDDDDDDDDVAVVAVVELAPHACLWLCCLLASCSRHAHESS